MPTGSKKASETLSDVEKAAMRATVRERKRKPDEDLEPEVRAQIEAWTGTDREIGVRLHELIRAAAPQLKVRTFYGMPAYADKKGKTILFIQDAAKFKARYLTLGFQDTAGIDDGQMWATSFAITGLTPAAEAHITDLVRRAAAHVEP